MFVKNRVVISNRACWLVLFWLHLLSGGGLFCRAVSVGVGNYRLCLEPTEYFYEHN